MFHRVPTASSIDLINSASKAKLAVYYRKVLTKLINNNNSLWFNTMCLKNKVCPNYISVSTKNKSEQANKSVKMAKILWLKTEIKNHYSKRYYLNLHLKLIHCALANNTHPIWFDMVDKQIREQVNFECHKRYLTLKFKLSELCKKDKIINSPANTSNAPTQKFYSRLVNLSKTTFDEDEEKLLHQGLGFAPPKPHSEHEIVKVAIDSDIALFNISSENKSKCLATFQKNCRKLHQTSNNDTKSHTKCIRKIKNKLANNNLILSKADKGNSIVILDKSEYISKVQDFIKDSNITMLKSDPTNSFQTKFKSVLKNCTNVIPKEDHYKLTTMNPSAPIFYGLPKLHKNNIPIRPVVSYINAPTYKLCKFLNNLIPELIDFNPKHSVKNTLELIGNIKNKHIPPNAKLVSFDVKSLFTSIPISKLLDIIKKQFKDNNVNSTVTSEVLKLLDLCLNQNYFCFNDIFYQQNEGLPMGSPLSPLLSEIFMNYFENVFLNSNFNLVKQLHFWYRYVDDILCLYSGTERQLQQLLTFLNNIDKNIQFTFEVEINKSINFLDITIEHITSKFSFSIHRKDTYTDTIIPSNSYHPWNIKLAAFHSLIDRLLKIPLNESNYNKELSVILNIAVNNGYSEKSIFKIINKKNRTKLINSFYLTTHDMNEYELVYRKLNYVKGMSSSIANEWKKLDIVPGFYNNYTLKHILVNNKLVRRKNPLLNSGVYEIKCNDCNFVYIGQTGRNFQTRFKEHCHNYITKTSQSNVAKHLVDNNHKCTIDNLSTLHNEKKGWRLTFLENFEIKKAVSAGTNLMNEHLDLINSPFIDTFVKEINPESHPYK